MQDDDLKTRVLSFLVSKRDRDGRAIGQLHEGAAEAGVDVGDFVAAIRRLYSEGQIGEVGGSPLTQDLYTVELYDE